MEDNYQIPRLDEKEIQRVIARSETSASSAAVVDDMDDKSVDDAEGESIEKFESALSVAKFFQRTQEMKRKQQEAAEARRKLEREKQAAAKETEKKLADAKKANKAAAVAFPLPQTSISLSKPKQMEEDGHVVDGENIARVGVVSNVSSSTLLSTTVPSTGSQGLPKNATVVTGSGPPAIPHVASENESQVPTTSAAKKASDKKTPTDNQDNTSPDLAPKEKVLQSEGDAAQQKLNESVGRRNEASSTSNIVGTDDVKTSLINTGERGQDAGEADGDADGEGSVLVDADENVHEDSNSSEAVSRDLGTRSDTSRPFGLAELRRRRDISVILSSSEEDTVQTDLDTDMNRRFDFTSINMSAGLPSNNSSTAQLLLDPLHRSRASHDRFPSNAHNTSAEDDNVVLDITGHYEDVLQDILDESNIVDHSVSSDVASLVSLGNIAHGRLGEQIAFEVLQREFASVASSIEWCNRAQEAFLPYDFIIEYPAATSAAPVSSSPLRRQYVEVKTRVTSAENGHHTHVGQWFISASELAAALDCTRQHGVSGEECYSCLLIHFERQKGEVSVEDSVDAKDGEYRLRHMYFVDDLIQASRPPQRRVNFVVHLSQQYR